MEWKLSNIQHYASEVLASQYLEKKSNLMQRLAQGFRMTAFELIHEAGSGHWGGSSSAAELLTVLYFHILNIDPEFPGNPGRDRFVLSKGHAAPMLYTVLAARGFFPVEELPCFRKLNSRLQGHPCMSKVPGVDMSTGALGHGLSVALGMSLAAPITKQSYWTFVLIGDGDLNEGETWEGIMAAAKFKPARLVFLVDYNRVQLDGNERDIMPTFPLVSKLEAFGIKVCPNHFDGNKVNSILNAWGWMQEQSSWPLALVFDTVKGKGISFTENDHRWHGAQVDNNTFERGLKELEDTFQKLEALC